MQSQKLNTSTMETHNVHEQSSINGSTNNASASSCFKGSIASSSSSSSLSSSLTGDYIGVESCLDLRDNDDVFETSLLKEKTSDNNLNLLYSRRDRRLVGGKKEKKEFPPPISLLARTGNLPCHTPWVLRRYYTSDGRLILKEERVRHHGFFRAQRSNGRLTLRLVPLDDDKVYSSDEEDINEEEEEDENGLENCNSEEEKEKADTDIDELEKILSDEEEEEEEEEIERNGNEKCLINADENEKGSEGKETNGIEKGLKENEKQEEDSYELGKCSNGGGEEASKEIQVNDNGGDQDHETDDECVNDDVNGNNIIMKKEILYDEDQRIITSVDNNGSNGNVGGNVSPFKCFNIKSTCIFQMPVPAMRPIHS